MINRIDYSEQIIPFIDSPLIKIITGIRRSGKSCVLQMLRDTIQKRNVSNENIVYINLESFAFSEINTAQKLNDFVKERISNSEKYYLFIDEVQEIETWEKAINSFLVDFNIDIYLTGSNSKLLSSELSTYLTGRYVEFQIQTLNFREFLNFKKQYKTTIEETHIEFNNFLNLGGFPIIHTGNYSLESTYKIVNDIFSSAVLRDTVQRYKIRDIEILNRIIKYAFDNIGNSFSGKNISDYFKNQFRKIDINTVYNYLNALESAFILQKVNRYDIKGKEILKTQEKYFVGDHSLIYSQLGNDNRHISGILENIVYLELKSRKYEVYIGKQGDKEIDFIAIKNNSKIYIQVAYQLNLETTIEREFNVLNSVKDNYPKYVVTMDSHWNSNINGIKQMHIADFLLLEKLD